MNTSLIEMSWQEKQSNLVFHKEDCYGRNGPAMTGNAALTVIADAQL